MNWCFAIINGKLSEIYYRKSKSGKVKYLGFCHVKRSDYETKKEQEWIRKDTGKFKMSYKNNRYKMLTKSKLQGNI